MDPWRRAPRGGSQRLGITYAHVPPPPARLNATAAVTATPGRGRAPTLARATPSSRGETSHSGSQQQQPSRAATPDGSGRPPRPSTAATTPLPPHRAGGGGGGGGARLSAPLPRARSAAASASPARRGASPPRRRFSSSGVVAGAQPFDARTAPSDAGAPRSISAANASVRELLLAMLVASDGAPPPHNRQLPLHEAVRKGDGRRAGESTSTTPPPSGRHAARAGALPPHRQALEDAQQLIMALTPVAHLVPSPHARASPHGPHAGRAPDPLDGSAALLLRMHAALAGSSLGAAAAMLISPPPPAAGAQPLWSPPRAAHAGAVAGAGPSMAAPPAPPAAPASVRGGSLQLEAAAAKARARGRLAGCPPPQPAAAGESSACSSAGDASGDVGSGLHDGGAREHTNALHDPAAAQEVAPGSPRAASESPGVAVAGGVRAPPLPELRSPLPLRTAFTSPLAPSLAANEATAAWRRDSIECVDDEAGTGATAGHGGAAAYGMPVQSDRRHERFITPAASPTWPAVSPPWRLSADPTRSSELQSPPVVFLTRDLSYSFPSPLPPPPRLGAAAALDGGPSAVPQPAESEVELLLAGVARASASPSARGGASSDWWLPSSPGRGGGLRRDVRGTHALAGSGTPPRARGDDTSGGVPAVSSSTQAAASNCTPQPAADSPGVIAAVERTPGVAPAACASDGATPAAHGESQGHARHSSPVSHGAGAPVHSPGGVAALVTALPGFDAQAHTSQPTSAPALQQHASLMGASAPQHASHAALPRRRPPPPPAPLMAPPAAAAAAAAATPSIRADELLRLPLASGGAPRSPSSSTAEPPPPSSLQRAPHSVGATGVPAEAAPAHASSVAAGDDAGSRGPPAAASLPSSTACAPTGGRTAGEPQQLELPVIRAYAGICEPGWDPVDPHDDRYGGGGGGGGGGTGGHGPADDDGRSRSHPQRPLVVSLDGLQLVRKTNQDAIALAEEPESDALLMAVFDGHGEHGHLVARWFAQRLPEAVWRHPAYSTLRSLADAPDNIPPPPSSSPRGRAQQQQHPWAAPYLPEEVAEMEGPGAPAPSPPQPPPAGAAARAQPPPPVAPSSLSPGKGRPGVSAPAIRVTVAPPIAPPASSHEEGHGSPLQPGGGGGGAAAAPPPPPPPPRRDVAGALVGALAQLEAELLAAAAAGSLRAQLGAAARSDDDLDGLQPQPQPLPLPSAERAAEGAGAAPSPPPPPPSGLVDLSMSGCTACVLVAVGAFVTVANVGDSRAVLVRRAAAGGAAGAGPPALTAWPLSVDHKPHLPGETRRILLAGGRLQAIRYDDGTDGPVRVWLRHADAPGLAMSRSLGDTLARSVGVSGSPDVYRYTLQPGDAYVAVASDGLWEFTPPAVVAAALHAAAAGGAAGARADGNDAAEPESRHLALALDALAEEAGARWRAREGAQDDLSVLVAEVGPA